MKIDFENNENVLGNLKGYEHIYRIIVFLIETVSAHKKSIKILDRVLKDSK